MVCHQPAYPPAKPDRNLAAPAPDPLVPGLGGSRPAPLQLLAIFAAGSFVMRSAGVVLNDLADRSFDRHVARTQVRPLASGELSVPHALLVLGFFLALAGLLVLLLDPLTILLSPIAIFLAFLYPFAKRIIHIPQAMLGIAFGWGTIMAWTSSRGAIDAPAWCLFAATVCWAIGYDTIYALQDLEDDRRIGVKSSALLFGSSTWIAVGTALCGMLLLLGLAGWLAQIGWAYYAVLAPVGVWCARQAGQIRGCLGPYRLPHVSTACVGRGRGANRNGRRISLLISRPAFGSAHQASARATYPNRS